MTRQLILTRRAQSQIEEMYERVARLSGSQEVAYGFVNRLFERLKLLPSAPFQGTRRSGFIKGLRTTSFEQKTVIAFHVSRSIVRVVAIGFNGEQYQKHL